MPIQVPVTQTGLEASIEAAAKRAGKSLKINLGSSAKSIEGLSQPLGRITGKADQFTKSMEAANARVLAFGASVGVLSAVQRGFADLVRTTVEVEKSLASINSILGTTTKELDKFKGTIFEVAKNTEQSFDTVATAALELSRQGLKAEEVTKRLNDSLVLSRLSGLGAAEAVAGLTSAINSFNSTGITSAEVLNKLSAAAVSAAVSERDLIEGIKRSGAVAIQAGVSFDELVGVITAVQERTARGGAVIGNSFKTIFTRIQSLDKLETMQNLGVQVTDASGQVLSATKLIQNLGKTLATLPDAKRLQIAENLVGKFQIAPFLAILEDYNRETSTAIRVTETASKATTEAYSRNVALNETLSAAINEATVNLKELANTLGEIGVTDSLRNILGFFNTLVGDIKSLLDGDGIGSDFARGFVKAIGGVISGPGLAIFGAIIAKLTIDLAKFGVGSLKTFFGLNRAAKEQATLQGQIASTLIGNSDIQKRILAIENSQLSTEQKKAAQTKFFTTALNEQLAVMTRMQQISARVTPGVFAGTRGARGRGAGGYIPNFNAVVGYGSEQSDINRGVGGAPKSARPVTIPNFNFGGGQKGTMVANTSEFMVPNFAGTGGSAIFNQDMVASMGLPSGAKRVGAAGGYIPNFAKKPINSTVAGMIIPRKGVGSRRATGTFGGNTFSFPVFGIDAAGEKVREEKDIKKSVERFSIGLATRESKSMTGGRPTAGKINRLANQGAIGGLAGAIFETALSSLLKSKDFDFGETATFDYVGQSAINNIGDISPALKGSGIKFLDAKIADNAGTRNSMAKKITSYFGASPTGSTIKGKGITELMKASGKDQKQVLGALGMRRARGASGYIPNFASPLEAAIGRESAAGLPINQIRINQDPSLRSAGNPMGLAVTNTRDEPTGAIPNFANQGFVSPSNVDPRANANRQAFFKAEAQAKKENIKATKESTKSIKTNVKGQRDMLGGIFAVQVGMSALSGATSDAEGGFMRFANRLTTLGSSLTTAAFAGSALNDFGKSLGGAGGKFVSKLGIYGAALSAGISLFKGLNNVIDDATGATDKSKTAMDKLADSAGEAALTLSGLSQVEKGQLPKRVKEARQELFASDATLGRFRELERNDPERAARLRALNLGTEAEGDLQLANNRKMGPVLDQILQRAIVAGLDMNVVRDIIKEQAVGGRVRKAQAGTDFTAPTQRAEILEFEELDRAADIIQGMRAATKDAVNLIDSFTDEKQLKDLAAFANITEQSKKGIQFNSMIQASALGNNTVEQAREFLRESNVVDKKSQDRLLLEAGKKASKELERIEQERLRKKEDADKRGARLAASIAKEAINNAVERVKAETGVLDAIDGQILAAETLGAIGAEELNNLREQRNNIDANLKLRNATADAAGKIVNASKEITMLADLEANLRGKLESLITKGVTTEEDRNEVLKMANELIEEGGQEVENALVPIMNALKREEDRVKNARELLNLNQQITLEIREQTLENEGALLRLGASSDSASVGRELGLRGQMARNSLRIARGEGDPLNINESRGRAVSNAQIERLNVGLQNQLDTELRERGQRQQIRGFIQNPALLNNLDLEKFNKRIDEASGDQLPKLAEELEKTVRSVRAGDGASLKFAGELTQAAAQMRDNNEISKQVSAANLELADAAITAAGKLGDLNFNQLIGDMITGLTSPQNIAQARIDALISTDPTARAKFNISEGNRAAKVAALSKKSDQGLMEFADIVREEEFSGQLIDASAQFAQNIGRAMTDAIAKGESLGGLLRNAAADFFNTLSQAFMQQAVNSIVGGGGFLGGVLGFLGRNSGGPVTGGSGNRDDVPALLTGGEFVMRKGAVKKYGAGFMTALNQGQIPMMNRGGLFTPGTYGQGAMKGKSNLLNFATQGFTTGAFDSVSGGAGFASVALEPQSAALTMFGRRNSPQFAQEQASKRSAFGLYVQQVNKEKQMREQEKQANRGLLGSILSFGLAFGLNSLFSGGIGGKAIGAADPRGGSFTKKADFSRILSVGSGGSGGSGGTGGVGGPANHADIGFSPNAITQRAVTGFRDGVLPPKFNNIGRATGGSIPYAAGVDTVPAMLSGGEFVMNAAATQRVGRGTLSAINSGGGGGNGSGAIIGKLEELISVSENQGETVINITVNSDGTSNESGNGNEEETNLATRIRDVVKQVIDDEKRLGGSLRQARA